MRKALDQILIGLWCAMGAAMGIMSKSWQTFGTFMLVAAFLAGGIWAGRALQSENGKVKRVAMTTAILYALFFVFMGMMVIERLYFVNGSSYASWLATKDLGNFDVDKNDQIIQLSKLSRENCPGGGAEINVKDDGLVVIRCGNLTWYDSQTFIAHFKDVK